MVVVKLEYNVTSETYVSFHVKGGIYFQPGLFLFCLRARIVITDMTPPKVRLLDGAPFNLATNSNSTWKNCQ